jgi:hypothetical protein
MTPKNFPGRKNDRRMAALARLGKDNGGTPVGRTSGKSLEVDREHLASLVTTPEMARAIRTKKDRSAFARIR